MRIRKAAVIGSGTMGAAVAAHLANAGIPTLLLDLVPPGAADRDTLAKTGVQRALKARPAAFMHPERTELITPGNLEDDLERLNEADWIFEAVLEDLDVKRELWATVEAAAAPHAILSSNSSGIPMRHQSEGRGDDFRRRFLGTHFFNPPRYLHLLEIIPTADTDPAVTESIRDFADRALGKGVVTANDVPGFVANRVGVHGLMHAIRDATDLGLAPDVVDALTGPLIGRPKSATYRTADLSGLDVVLKVARDLHAATRFDYAPPAILERLVALGRLGDKTGEGFYKRERTPDGENRILTVNFDTLEYEHRGRARLPAAVDAVRALPSPTERIRALMRLDDPHGEFIRRAVLGAIHFAAANVPECTPDPLEIDRAMRWGFAWHAGPFELCDALGARDVARALEARGLDVPPLIAERVSAAEPRFHAGAASAAPGPLSLAALRDDPGRVVKRSSGASLLDAGDGVAVLELHAKANAIGEDAARMIAHAMTVVPRDFTALVIAGDGEYFSAGANLAVLLMHAQNGDWDDLDLAVRGFQRMTTSLRSSPFPTVVAPFNRSLGGGCELSLHADHVQAHAELYTGLVETGVGLLPAGGGSTELLARLTSALLPGDDPFNAVRQAFEQIMLAKVSSSALEARDLHYLRASDGITMNRDRLLEAAKRRALELARDYAPPAPRAGLLALGEGAVAKLKLAAWTERQAGRATEHDAVVAAHVARVLSGGTANHATLRPEQHFLDLEREAFLTLVSTPRTQQRIAHTLKTGKPLRN